MKNRNKLLPEPNELPSSFADRMGIHYTSFVSQEHKKERGQFFTPTAIARLMASFVSYEADAVRILDPGCGTAVLACALIEYLVNENEHLRRIDLIVYETDVSLISCAEDVLTYLKKWLHDKGINLNHFLHIHDFILDNADSLKEANSLFVNRIELFDFVISNPPYFKLSKDDQRTKAAKVVVSGQPNIYSFFMAIGAKLLKLDGELIFITPRSFSSGNYFKAF